MLGERGEPLGVLDVLTLMEGALLRQQEGNALQMGGLFGSAVAGGGGVAAASAASDTSGGAAGASESLGVPSANDRPRVTPRPVAAPLTPRIRHRSPGVATSARQQPRLRGAIGIRRRQLPL